MSRVPDDNPYAPPLAGSGESGYYQFVSTGVTFRELWCCAWPNVVAFALVAIAKLLRMKLAAPFGFASQATEIISIAALPEHVRAALATTLEASGREDFGPRFALQVPSVGDCEGYELVSAHRDGTIVMAAIYVRHGKSQQTDVSLQSELSDGRVLITTGARPRLLSPPRIDVLHRAGDTIAELARRHRARLADEPRARAESMNEQALVDFIWRMDRRVFEFQHQRGVWMPMSVGEVDRLRAATGE